MFMLLKTEFILKNFLKISLQLLLLTNVLFFFFFIFKILFNFSFFTIAYCMSISGDSDDIIIPGKVVRAAKQAAPFVIHPLIDFSVLAGTFGLLKGMPIPFAGRVGGSVALYGAYKTYDVIKNAVDYAEKRNILNAASSTKDSFSDHCFKAASILESTVDWLNSQLNNMSEVKIVASCGAILLIIALIIFTALMTWVIGREYAEKAKSFMKFYPKLNKVFLFYLKWGEITSIPARIFFTFIVYLEIILCIYYLTFIPSLS